MCEGPVAAYHAISSEFFTKAAKSGRSAPLFGHRRVFSFGDKGGRGTAIIGFLADAVVGTVDELLATRKALTELTRLWRARRAFRSGSAATRALAFLPHYPVLTVNRLSDLVGVSFKGASVAMDQLASVGIVSERTGYAKNRVFAATEVLSIINRPFGAEPILPAV